MIRTFVIASALLLILGCLGGCAGGGMNDVDAKKEEKEIAAQTAKGFGSIDDAKCRSFGFQPGSPAYAKCRSDYESLHAKMDIE